MWWWLTYSCHHESFHDPYGPGPWNERHSHSHRGTGHRRWWDSAWQLARTGCGRGLLHRLSRNTDKNWSWSSASQWRVCPQCCSLYSHWSPPSFPYSKPLFHFCCKLFSSVFQSICHGALLLKRHWEGGSIDLLVPGIGDNVVHVCKGNQGHK